MKDPDYLKIASRIKSRRLQLGYSYQTLAEKVGLNKSTLHRYETGKIKSIPLSRLVPLCNALDMDLNDLIKGGHPL